MKIHLLVIDGQVDFCDPRGALYVAGAEGDMERTAGLIQRLGPKLDDLHLTMDAHHRIDVAHPLFWRNTKGEHPSPFTIITADNVHNGVWLPVFPSLIGRVRGYVEALAQNGRYPLCVWPEHCLIGSPGACLHPALLAAVHEWEGKNGGLADYVTKGSNPFTEHYSAIKAEVPDPADPTTGVNTPFIQALLAADILAVAGEAGSHCVANTVRDIASEFGSDDLIRKIVLLTDCMSPVPTFEKFQEDFFLDMKARGVQFSTSKDFLK